MGKKSSPSSDQSRSGRCNHATAPSANLAFSCWMKIGVSRMKKRLPVIQGQVPTRAQALLSNIFILFLSQLFIMKKVGHTDKLEVFYG